MSDKCETVVVERKDHPEGQITINKEDLQEDDKVIGSEKESTGPKEGTKEWLKVQLKEKGVDFDESMNKAQLQELLDSQQ